MIDRVGEVYECKESGEIFVILSPAYIDNIGDQKWNTLIIHASPTYFERPSRVGEITVYSEMWFSDSLYSWKMRRLSGAPQERREGC